MSDPQVSLNTIAAVVFSLTGLVLVTLSFWLNPGVGFTGLAFIASGDLLAVRGFLLAGRDRREKDAFELGRETGQDRERDRPRNLRD